MVNIVTPRVTLLGHTQLANTGDGTTAIEEWMHLDPTATDAENLIEFAGRGCYLSWHKPNPATAANADYIERTVFEQQHGSIAEHVSATLYSTGVSRALTHELVRHRHLSYSQLSQRFVDESDANVVMPPAIRDADPALKHYFDHVTDGMMYAYESISDHLGKTEGNSRKQNREAARSVLPNAVETRIVVTGNLRAWAEVIARRTAPDADAEIQEVMGIAREVLTPIAPAFFKHV